LSSALVAQAWEAGPSLCTLCLVDKDVAKNSTALKCSDPKATPKTPWTDFQGLFHQGGGPVDIHGPGCIGEVTNITNTQGGFIALCCVSNNFQQQQP
jgi:hypothetical protein